MTHNYDGIKRLCCFKTIYFEAGKQLYCIKPLKVKVGIGHMRDCRGHESDFRGHECVRTLLELANVKLNCKYLISSM